MGTELVEEGGEQVVAKWSDNKKKKNVTERP